MNYAKGIPMHTLEQFVLTTNCKAILGFPKPNQDRRSTRAKFTAPPLKYVIPLSSTASRATIYVLCYQMLTLE